MGDKKNITGVEILPRLNSEHTAWFLLCTSTTQRPYLRMQKHENTSHLGAFIHCCLIPSAFPHRASSSWQSGHRILIFLHNKQSCSSPAEIWANTSFNFLFWYGHASLDLSHDFHHDIITSWNLDDTHHRVKCGCAWVYPWSHLVSLSLLQLLLLLVLGHFREVLFLCWGSCWKLQWEKITVLPNTQASPLGGTDIRYTSHLDKRDCKV